MLLQEGAGSKHHTVGVVARFADEHGAHLGSRLAREERLRGDKYLLDISRVLHEVGDAVGGRNLAHILEVVSLDQVAKPGRSELDGDRVAIQILEAFYG